MIGKMFIKPTLLAFLFQASFLYQPIDNLPTYDGLLGSFPFYPIAYTEYVGTASADREDINNLKVDNLDFGSLVLLLKETAAERGLDPSLCVAISRLETGNFTSKAFIENNNWGGLTEGHISSYNSKEDGLIAFMDCLAWYKDNGTTTPEEMASTYCPDNPNWAGLVREIMREVE